MCLDGPKQVFLKPCEHMNMCCKCYKVLKDREGDKAQCPVCRIVIEEDLGAEEF